MPDTIIDNHDYREPSDDGRSPEPLHRRRSGLGWGVAALVAVAGIGGFAWYATRPQPAIVERRDITGNIPVVGEVIIPASARADILPPFRANVDKVETSVGKTVQRGDILVRLSLPSAEAYHEQTKAAEKAAETAYANARNQASGAVKAAQQQVDAARAAERAARQPVTSTANPDGSTTVTTPSGDAGQASSDRMAAEQALQQAIADRDAQIVAYKQQLDYAREANRAARNGEKQGYVRAPISGTVLALNAQPGGEVGADARVPVATIVNLNRLQVQSPLEKSAAAAVKPTMPVTLTFTDLPNKTFEGKVLQLTSRVVSKMRGLVKESQYSALISFKNVDGLVKPGMKPVVALETGTAKNALAVPSAAVGIDSAGRAMVKVSRSGKWEQIPVTTGVSDGRYTEIKTGIQQGETVAITPNILNAAPLKQ